MIDSATSLLLVARTLAWALLIGGWLVLGDLGSAVMPFELGGLAPMVLFLGVTGIVLRAGATLAVPAMVLRFVLLATAAVAAGALLRTGHSASLIMVACAAAGWAALLVAASRAVKMLRARARRAPPPILPATAGAALAWLVSGDPGVALTTAPAIGLLAAAALLAIMLPSRGITSGCRGGLFDCALPLGGWSHWSNPAKWPTQAASWAMLPMMASMSVMTQWCRGEVWLSTAAIVGLHLGAMLMPPLTLYLLRVTLRAEAWVAAAMTAGLLLSLLSTSMLGLMLASMCQSLGWSLAWFARIGDAPRIETRAAAPTWFGALVPACCIALLGVAVTYCGPSALRGTQIGLGALAAVGAALSLWKPAAFNKLEKRP